MIYVLRMSFLHLSFTFRLRQEHTGEGVARAARGGAGRDGPSWSSFPQLLSLGRNKPLKGNQNPLDENSLLPIVAEANCIMRSPPS